MLLKIELRLRDYISSPFTEALSKKIEIEKKSGTRRARSSEKAKEALVGYLEKIEMTPEQWDELCEEAAKVFYRNGSGKVMIPRHHLAGMCVQVVRNVPKSVRGALNADSFRAEVRLSDFETDKGDADGTFERYIKNENTNERRFHADSVISDFAATGTAELLDDDLRKDFEAVLSYGLKRIGVGSARKMGFGRGEIVRVTEAK